MIERSEPAPRARTGTFVGPIRITPARVLLAVAFVVSLAYSAYVVLRIEDNQIPLLTWGLVALGLSLATFALMSLRGIWRAASRARGGQSLALAIVGGLAALAAIGCFSIAALLVLVWNS